MNTIETKVQTVQRAINDCIKLMRLHLELIREEAKSVGSIASMTITFWFLIAIVAIPSFLMLLFGLNHWLQNVTPLSTWQTEIIVGGTFLILCVGAAGFARAQLLKFKEGLL